jgi:2-hydroxychromene-2-carboxylate isomerase
LSTREPNELFSRISRVPAAGLEPATHGLEGRRSIQLSYAGGSAEYGARGSGWEMRGIRFRPAMPPTLFYFGAMSPYSWFAAERIEMLIPDAQWRPVFAGGLFRTTGRSSWGLSDRREAGIVDCEARALRHGLGPMRWPDGWPSSDLLVARALVAADRQGWLQPFALAVMRAEFRDGARLDEPAVLRRAAGEVGLDGSGLIDATSTPEIKDSLRARNDEAVALGVSGVPTVVIGDQLFWGDDRLDEAAQL